MSNLLDEVIKATPTMVDTDLIRWGQVISTGPLKVRFAGDTSDITVALQADGMVLASGDKVACLKLGAQWVVASKLVAPADATLAPGVPLSVHGQYPPYESGKFYSSYGWYGSTTTATMDHDYLTFCPIVITRTVDVVSLVSGNSTSATFKWGFYETDIAGYPSNLLDSGTETALAATTAVSLTSTLSLSPGLYVWAINPSAGEAWRVQSNHSSGTYTNEFNFMDLGQTTAAAALTASHPTGTPWGRVAHTYENDIPDPLSGTYSNANENFLCGFEVA